MYVRYFVPEIKKWQRKIIGVFSGSNKDTVNNNQVWTFYVSECRTQYNFRTIILECALRQKNFCPFVSGCTAMPTNVPTSGKNNYTEGHMWKIRQQQGCNQDRDTRYK